MSQFKVLYKKSSVVTDGEPKLPTSGDLDYGEIAINFGAGAETISLKNSDDEIVSLRMRDDLSVAASALAAHEARNDNPHGVTKAQVGLSDVDNTPDMDKPLSTAQQAAVNSKLDNAANGGVVNNLTTNDTTKALSAAQGVALSKKINEMTGGAIADLTALEDRVAGVEEEIETSSSYIDNTLAPKAESLLTLTI